MVKIENMLKQSYKFDLFLLWYFFAIFLFNKQQVFKINIKLHCLEAECYFTLMKGQ
jgi:hypothetical protein